MPSKFKKALGAVKDHTSIGLAKVSKTATGSSSSQLDLLVLKATTHDEVPFDDRYVDEILVLISTSRPYATACVQALSRRIDRTRNWVVAIKCLQLVFRAFRDGGPYFPRETLSAMRRGSRLLNQCGFRDESARSSPWDYTAFVRTFALYLDERLDSMILGKLRNRRPMTGPNRLSDMKPAVILDRIAYWQRLLDRAVATRPTGPARNNLLVHVSLCLVVRESFELYKDVSDGLALILDNFFQLQHRTCLEAYQTCVRAARQLEELAAFYDMCKSIGVGRRSEYPEVQNISGKLLETLSDFIKGNQDPTAVSSSLVLKPKVPIQMLLPSPPWEEPQEHPSVPPKHEHASNGDLVKSEQSPIGSNSGDQKSCTVSNLVPFDEMPNANLRTSEYNGLPEGQRLSVDSCGGGRPSVTVSELAMSGERLNGLSTPSKQSGTPEGQRQSTESGIGSRLSCTISDMMLFDEMPNRVSKKSEQSGLPAGQRQSTEWGNDNCWNCTVTDLAPFGEMSNGVLNTSEQSGTREGQRQSTELGNGSRLSCIISDLVLFDEMPNGVSKTSEQSGPSEGQQQLTEWDNDNRLSCTVTDLARFDIMSSAVLNTPKQSCPREGQRQSTELGNDSRLSCTISDLVLFEEMTNGVLKPSEQNGPPEWQRLSTESGYRSRLSCTRTDLALLDEMSNGVLNTSEQSGPAEAQCQSIESRNDNRLSCTITDLVLFDDQPEASTASCSDEWELVLAQTASDISTQMNHSFSEVFEPVTVNSFQCQTSSSCRPHLQDCNNPFLDDTSESCNNSLVVWTPPPSSLPPPTFRAGSPDDAFLQPETDPFLSSFDSLSPSLVPPQPLDMPARQQLMQQEQNLWLKYQRKIIDSRNLAS